MSPSQYAADFRENLELAPDTVVPEIVSLIEKAGYKYEEEDFGNDFAAFTKWLGSENYLIAYNSGMQYGTAFKRFSLAHELGHIAMHANILRNQEKLVSSQGLSTKDPVELEANEFAAHFLMPSRVFGSKIGTLDFSPANIRGLAQHFQVSEISAAMHFVKHTDLACTMIVCDSQGTTRWENRSPRLTDIIKPASYVNKSQVPETSSVSEWTNGQETEQKVVIPLIDWMPDLSLEMETEEWVMKTPDNLYLSLLTPLTLESED